MIQAPNNLFAVFHLSSRLIPAIAIAFCSSGLAAAAAPAKPAVEYNRDIRPILSDNCFLCHGPDKNTRKAKLRLDLRDEAIKLGAITPGHPEKSELVSRIFASNPDDLMPPAEAHKHLTSVQKETLRRWVAEGAAYQPHWAYVQPTRPDVPTVKSRKFVGNAIDAFIVHSLEEHGLTPSREAGKRVLLRRLSLDLIGLPPTPAEMESFLADRSPNSYEKQVDRLLTSPHFGERMAVPWLDTARFTDTVGYHGDQNQRIFPYRDYVIDAFNRNKRFDQFTIEQLAGDLLPNPTVEQRIATGFNRLNMMTREGGAQPGEYLAKYAADRVRTVATTWLGSTMGCCECHDHKFDPFTARDFYSMAAFFADVKQWGVYQDYKYTPNPELKDWSNDHPFPPELEVDSEPLRRRAGNLRRQIQELFLAEYRSAETNPALPPARLNWEHAVADSLKSAPDGWRVLTPRLPEPEPPAVTTTTNVTEGATNLVRTTNPPAPALLTADANHAVHAALNGKKDEAKIDFPLSRGTIAALRMTRLPRPRENSSVRLTATLVRGSKETKLTFYRADAARKEPRFSNGEEILGVLDTWRPPSRASDKPQAAVWLPEPPIEARDGDVLRVSLRSAGPVTAGFATSPLADLDPLQSGATEAFRAALARPARERTADDESLLAGRFFLSTQRDKAAFSQFKKLQGELMECHEGRTHTLITVAMKPFVTRVLPRGNWQNESGEIVQPNPPHFLPPPPRPGADETRLTRLDLAHWLVARDNPLTARVFVNRLWKQFFGTGISAAVDDVGAQGEWPSHPALLDWLATEFMNSGWDVKHMVRTMVLSRSYRQESNLRRDLLDKDPQNRWLSSQNPRRLDAEFVRDNALFIAGLLNLEMGGPSVRPYQPAGYYANLQFPDRDYVPQEDDRQYRRGVYMHWQRTFLHPMLANFDAPGREECTATRVVSNTPQQALTLLNDPTFIEASRVFATKLISSSRASDAERITAAYQTALGRDPKPKELSSLKNFLAVQRAHYGEHTDEVNRVMKVGIAPVPETVNRTELAAWTQVCRVVLNLHEGVTRY